MAVPYVDDVEFLLREFESKAGELIKVKGIDWPAVTREFQQAAAHTTTDEAHLQLVARLVGQLRDGHAGIVKSKIKWPDESKGRRFTGPRVALLTLPDRVLVRAAFKDALQSGLHAGQEVTRIDGVPALDWLKQKAEWMRDRGQGFSTTQMALYSACHWGLADYEGTPITFEIKDASGAELSIQRVRNGGPNYAPIGPLFPPTDLKFTGRQSYGHTEHGLGYIHLRDVPGNLPMQIQQMLATLGEIPGLILDMRANGGGGCDHEAVFGHFLAKGQSWRGYVGKFDGGYTGPMVVIVDAGVRSAGETIAGMFKEDGRAYMIGESATAGTSSQKTEITTPSGLFTIRFSVGSNKSRFNNGRGIEGIGVQPHELVLPTAQDLLNDKDTLIEHATKLLKAGLPKGIVPYQGPDSQ
ncbi:MAG: S41 family peptidase [Verrucomicrobiaceae bacterium]|nr:S41 family peptidase [Verrucomicrobiaceae bacterium]